MKLDNSEKQRIGLTLTEVLVITSFHQGGRLSAFTRIELVAIIAVAVVLAALAVCALADAKAKSRGICCNCRLKLNA